MDRAYKIQGHGGQMVIRRLYFLVFLFCYTGYKVTNSRKGGSLSEIQCQE